MRFKKKIALMMSLCIAYSNVASFASTPAASHVVKTLSISPTRIEVIYDGKPLTFNTKPYMKGKEIMVPATPLFTLLKIAPKIDKSTGIYSFDFDGADVSFNPKSGNLTFIEHYMPYKTWQLNNVCEINNNVLYLNSSRFPFCWLGLGIDQRISSDGKFAKLHMSKELKVVDERFSVTDSRSGKVERKYKKDPNKPLDVSWLASVTYETLPMSNKGLFIHEKQPLPDGESRIEYQVFKYNGGTSGDIRSLLSSEMVVYDIMLYKKGVLTKTLHDFAPPRTGNVSSIRTTASEFDEIRFRVSIIFVDQLDEIFKQACITI